MSFHYIHQLLAFSILTSPSFLPLYVCIDVSREREEHTVYGEGRNRDAFFVGVERLISSGKINPSECEGAVSSALVESSHIPLTQFRGVYSFPACFLTLTADGLPDWPYIGYVVWFWQQVCGWEGKDSPTVTLRNFSIVYAHLEPVNLILSPSSFFSCHFIQRCSKQPASLVLFFYKLSKVLCVESLNSLFLAGGKSGVSVMCTSVRSSDSPYYLTIDVLTVDGCQCFPCNQPSLW